MLRTVTCVPTEDIDHVRDTLSCLYGAVAAIARDDRVGADLLLADMCTDMIAANGDVAELLSAISFATLDRLDAALGTAERPTGRESRAIAQYLLTEVHRYSLGDSVPVQSAARRLDAIRRHDHDQANADIANDRAATTDGELVWGAAALLTATVAMWAQRSGLSTRRAAADLCLAVSAVPVT